MHIAYEYEHDGYITTPELLMGPEIATAGQIRTLLHRGDNGTELVKVKIICSGSLDLCNESVGMLQGCNNEDTSIEHEGTCRNTECKERYIKIAKQLEQAKDEIKRKSEQLTALQKKRLIYIKKDLTPLHWSLMWLTSSDQPMK